MNLAGRRQVFTALPIVGVVGKPFSSNNAEKISLVFNLIQLKYEFWLSVPQLRDEQLLVASYGPEIAARRALGEH